MTSRAVVTSQGGVFVTETGKRASSLAGAFLAESVTTGGLVDLAGNLALTPALGGSLTAILSLSGNLAPSIPFVGSLGQIFGLSGDLAPVVSFVGPLQSILSLAGDLAPATSFAGDLSQIHSLTGNFAPAVTFTGALSLASEVVNYVDLAGNLGSTSRYGRGPYGMGKYSRGGPFTVVFAGELADWSGDLAPVVTFAGEVGFDLVVSGALPIEVTFAGDLISGSLWKQDPGCPPPLWAADPGCPPSPWSKDDQCDAAWTETELCSG